MMSRRLYFVLALALVAGCATTTSTTSSTTTPAVAMVPQDLVGQWSGTWTDPQYASLGSSLDIVSVAGGDIAGTYSIDGNAYVMAGSFPFKSTLKNEGTTYSFAFSNPSGRRNFKFTLQGDKLRGRSDSSTIVMTKKSQ